MLLAVSDIYANVCEQLIGLLRCEDKRNKKSFGQWRDVVERVDTADLPTYQKLEKTVYTRQYFVDRIGMLADIRPHLKEECRLQLFPGGLVHVKVLVKSVQRRFYCFLNATQLLAISRIF